MGPVSYRVRSVLRVRRRRAGATAAIVAVVGGLVLTLTAGVARTLSAPERYSAVQGDEYDVSIEQQGGRARAGEVAGLPAVAAVDMATFVFAGVTRGGVESAIEALVFVGSPRALVARLLEGRAPDPAVAGEFVATQSWLVAADAVIGDRFDVVTITQEQSDQFGFDVAEPAGPTVPASLVGVIGGPGELQDETPLALFGFGLLDEGDVGVASSVGVLALAPQATVADLRAQLDALPGGEAFGLGTAEWVPQDVRTAVRAEGQGLAVVAAIVAVAAIAVLGQLLSRQVRSSEAQRMALRAIGLTRAQVVVDPVCATALPVAVGSIGAGLIAVATSGIFPIGFSRRVEPDRGLLVDPLVHLAGPIVIAVLLVASVSVVLALAERERVAPARPGPVASMLCRAGLGPARTGARFAVIRHPHGAASVRAPIGGLVLIQLVVVGALTFGSSVDRFVDSPSRYGSNFDFATGAGGDEVPEEVRTLLAQDPDVADVTLFGTLFAGVGTASLDVTGMQQVRGSLEPDVLAGRLVAAPDEITLGRVAARDLGIGINDVVDVVGASGAVPFRVTGFAVIPSVEGGDGVGEGAVVTLEGLRRIDPRASLGVAAVRMRSGASADAVRRLEDALGGTVGMLDRPFSVLNVDRVRATPWIVAGSLAALAVLSLSHQLINSTRRRRRDLAMLRALGADRRWVSSVVHWQVTVLAVGVSVVAVPLGIIAGHVVHRSYIDRIGARNDVSVPFVTVTWLVIGVLALGNIAAVIAASRVRRETPARGLAAE